MEGPYSARFPSSPGGETSRRASVIRGAADERADRLRRLPGGHRVGRVSSCTMTGQPDPDFTHRPVMADEIVDLFAPVPPGWLVDATLGGAGHASALLEAHPQLKVLGIDQDPDALAAAGARLAPFGDSGPHGPGPLRRPHVGGGGRDPGPTRRGLSVRPRGELPAARSGRAGLQLPPRRSARHAHGSRWPPAAPHDVVNGYDEADLARVLRTYGDERFAGRIAKAIVAARPVHTTGELADLVRNAIPAPARRRGGHPAKRTFQAIRIEVNEELDVLPVALEAGHRRPRSRRTHRRALVPLGRGPHREAGPPRRRDRRLHLPAGPSVRVRGRADASAFCAGAVAPLRPPSSRPTPAPRAPASVPPRSWRRRVRTPTEPSHEPAPCVRCRPGRARAAPRRSVRCPRRRPARSRSPPSLRGAARAASRRAGQSPPSELAGGHGRRGPALPRAVHHRGRPDPDRPAAASHRRREQAHRHRSGPGRAARGSTWPS